ncbi:hypothetical protein PybrP1_012477, partial [[Pythium] brassicae (nom. inval.)]
AFYNANHAGLTFWTPNVNIYRDPRWGRGQETPGEDPLLSAEYAVAFVRGLQGDAPEIGQREADSASSPSPSPPPFLKVSACCKHFSSYSQEEARHRNDAIVSPRDQADTYFPAFEACVTRGRVSAIMCSYNAVNGVPACADKALLTGLVRGQWGFDGYVVSDCGAVADVLYEHHYTQSPAQTCASTMNAGIDLNCGTFLAAHGKQALASGLLHQGVVRRALKRLFRVQMRLGMFEQGGQPFAALTPAAVDTPAHRQLALEAAQQAIVLLKNVNATLPLRAEAFADTDADADADADAPVLALIGPHANASAALLGNYQGVPAHIVTPLEGVAAYAKRVAFVRGCKVAGETVADFDEAERVAAQAAQVVLFVGLDQSQEREELDRAHLKLPGFQRELIAAVLASATAPVVLVVISGGSVDLAAYRDHPKVGAILFAGYLGQAGGRAIADVLFGAFNPVGKLTQTFYSSAFAEQVSLYDMNMRPTPATGNPGRTYRFLSRFELVVYGFGRGLSYTEFKVEWENNAATSSFVSAESVREALASASSDRRSSESDSVTAGASASVSVSSSRAPSYKLNVTVMNVGQRAGEYTLTIFTFPPGGGSDGRPICFLSAFGRTPMLGPQEKFRFEFEISAATFALANAAGAWEVREGAWFLQTSVDGSDGMARHEVRVGSSPSSSPSSTEKKKTKTTAEVVQADEKRAKAAASENKKKKKKEEEEETVVDALMAMQMQAAESAL